MKVTDLEVICHLMLIMGSEDSTEALSSPTSPDSL